MAARGVTLKLATSLDGRIATGTGESRWITGPEAREAVHALRARHDAVAVGIETVLADDPELTVRIPGRSGPQPARVVFDSRQRLPSGSRLARTAGVTPTLVISTDPPRSRLTDLGVEVLQVPASADGRPRLAEALEALAAQGLASLFLEGGGRLAASFVQLDLIDRLEWFRAPIVLGAEGRPALGPLALERLADAPRFRRLDVRPAGGDLWESYGRV